MKFLFTILFTLFSYINLANANITDISCIFKVDKMYEVDSGKVKKMKIYDDEKVHNIKIKNFKSTSKNNLMQNYSAVLNGNFHEDRKVEISEMDRVIYVSQTDAYSDEYFAHYTVFKTQTSKKGMVSFMYTIYPSNWGYGAVKYHRGHCNIK